MVPKAVDAWDMRSGRATIISVCAALALAGCGPQSSVPSIDGGPSLRGDRDGDYLCDYRELEIGTDPDDPDTDGDGFPDGIEFIIASRNDNPASPDPASIDYLTEGEGNSIQASVSLVVNGEGEDYLGSFDDGRGPLYRTESTAADFYAGATSTFVEPPDHAALVDSAASAFRGVNGRSLLGFELRFEYSWPGYPDCVRLYPYRFDVKRTDGRIVESARRYLGVLGPGQTIESGPWCALAAGDCI